MKDEDVDPLEILPAIKGYPRPGEPPVENLPAEWREEDRQSQRRKPDLGEIEEDPTEN